MGLLDESDAFDDPRSDSQRPSERRPILRFSEGRFAAGHETPAAVRGGGGVKSRNWIERKLCYDLVGLSDPKLLWRILRAIASVLLLDSRFLQMLSEARWISLVEKNLLSLADDLFTSELADALISLWRSLKQIDCSEDSASLREFLQKALLRPLLQRHFQRDQVLEIHNAVVRDFPLLLRTLPADSYVDWLLAAQLTNETPAVDTLKRFAEKTESFAPFYRGFTLIAGEKKPFPAILFPLFPRLMGRPFIALITSRFFDESVAIEVLTREIEKEKLVETCYCLLPHVPSDRIAEFLPFCLFSLHLSALKPSSEKKSVVSHMLDMLYDLVCVCDSSLIPAETVQRCTEILVHWMYGVSVRSAVPWKEPVSFWKSLPLCCWLLRLAEKRETVETTLGGFVETLSKPNSEEVCHRILRRQSVLKELVLLHDRENANVLLLTLVVNDFNYSSFATNFLFAIRFILAHLKEEGLQLVGLLCSSVNSLLLGCEAISTTIQLNNLQVFLSVIEEIGVASPEQIHRYCELATLETLPENIETVIQLLGVKENPVLNNAVDLFNSHRSVFVSSELTINLSIYSIVIPLLRWVSLQKIGCSNYVCYDFLLLVLFRILYFYSASPEKADCSIRSIVQEIHSLLLLTENDITQYSYGFFSYLVVLKECVSVSSEKEYLNSEVVEMLKLYSNKHFLPKLLSLPVFLLSLRSFVEPFDFFQRNHFVDPFESSRSVCHYAGHSADVQRVGSPILRLIRPQQHANALNLFQTGSRHPKRNHVLRFCEPVFEQFASVQAGRTRQTRRSQCPKPECSRESESRMGVLPIALVGNHLRELAELSREMRLLYHGSSHQQRRRSAQNNEGSFPRLAVYHLRREPFARGLEQRAGLLGAPREFFDKAAKRFLAVLCTRFACCLEKRRPKKLPRRPPWIK